MIFRITLLPALLTLMPLASAQANDAALVLASQPNDQKAIEYAQSLAAKGAIRNVSEITFLRSSNGWLAISLGIFAKDECNSRLGDIKGRVGIPKDAYCTPTQRFTEKYALLEGKLQASSLATGSNSVSASPPTSTASAPSPASSDTKQSGVIPKTWNALSGDMARCADLVLRRNKSSIASLTQNGVAPDDPRIQSVMNFCKDVTSTTLRKNIDCELQTTTGLKIVTKCDEEFVYITPSGAKFPLSFDDVVQRRLENSPVSILQTERADAADRRRASEQKKQEEEKLISEQKAAEERQRNAELLAKRQEAEAAEKLRESQRQAELQKEAEAARRIAAEEAAKKRASGPLVDVNDQGIIIGRPFFDTKSVNYFSCEAVLNPKLKEAAFLLTSGLSKNMNVPQPQEALCSVSQWKAGTTFNGMISVNMYINDASMQSCIYNNYCNDTRSVTLVPGKNGEILFNTMVINASSRQMKQVCMNMKGEILSEQGCASVK